MKSLIAVESYPDLQGGINLYYVHARNMAYKEAGIYVTVLNFSAQHDYIIDGIEVITEKTYEKCIEKEKYGKLLIIHACNLKHHYRFVKKYGSKFDNYMFFFHGHEVLKCAKVYPKPYKYIKRNLVLEKAKDIYDIIKLKMWKRFFEENYQKIQFVFVSNWMYDEFLKWTKVNKEYLVDRYHIIYNCIGKEFERITYNTEKEKKYDIISIRNNLDGSKYCVDVICRIAEENPAYKMCLIGKGNYFEHYEKPHNLEVIPRYLKHEEILRYLEQSKCALMPTRTDAQGVMACELATYGIPLITSDIPVCKEVFEGFKNVYFISNDKDRQNFSKIFNYAMTNREIAKNQKYFGKNTTQKEIELIKTLR